MRKYLGRAVCLVPFLCATLLCTKADAQAFRKGSLFISLTEGGTHAHFGTTNTAVTNDGGVGNHVNGDRDPLNIEYALSNHWGIGINLGSDIFRVDPNTYYGFSTSTGKVTALMSEVMIDGNYHYFVTKHTDLSVFAALGIATVTVMGDDGADSHYQYNAGGGIIRVGGMAKYYVTHRFGFTGMFSLFSANTSPKDVKGNTVGQTRTTAIRGNAIEFGLCYRFFKGK